MKEKITIIHQDEDIIILNKPPHLLSIPDRYAPERLNLLSYLEKKFGKIFVVHRLDKDTSGVICFARNEKAHKHLNQQFENRTTEKIYHAILLGCPHEESGVIDVALAQHPGRHIKMILSRKGKASITHYKVLEDFGDFSLVEANIKTGRMHQIRIHFKSIGHPLAIDPTYGGKEGFFVSQLKGRKYRLAKDEVEKPLSDRLTLHAHQLAITHPTSNERMAFKADYPKDFRAILSQLRKWRK